MYRRSFTRLPNRHWEPNYSADTGYSKPPGNSAPAEARALWNEAYQSAETYYKGQRAPDPHVIASNTAWKTLNLYWRKTPLGKIIQRNPSQIQMGKVRGGEKVYFGEAAEPIEGPGKTTQLGKFLEVAWIDENGVLHVQRFKEPGLPDLVWNDRTKTLMAFPTTEVPDVCTPNLEGLGREAKMLSEWAEGRKAKCQVPMRVDNYLVMPVGVADTLVYRSDKFDGKRNPHPDLKGAKEYVHQFDDDVFIEETGSKPPDAILISGGRLDVERRGIIH